MVVSFRVNHLLFKKPLALFSVSNRLANTIIVGSNAWAGVNNVPLEIRPGDYFLMIGTDFGVDLIDPINLGNVGVFEAYLLRHFDLKLTYEDVARITMRGEAYLCRTNWILNENWGVNYRNPTTQEYMGLAHLVSR